MAGLHTNRQRSGSIVVHSWQGQMTLCSYLVATSWLRTASETAATVCRDKALQLLVGILDTNELFLARAVTRSLHFIGVVFEAKVLVSAPHVLACGVAADAQNVEGLRIHFGNKAGLPAVPLTLISKVPLRFTYFDVHRG